MSLPRTEKPILFCYKSTNEKETLDERMIAADVEGGVSHSASNGHRFLEQKSGWASLDPSRQGAVICHYLYTHSMLRCSMICCIQWLLIMIMKPFHVIS